MMILGVFTTILSLLASWSVPEVTAQGPIDFDFPVFDATSRNSLNFLYNATIDTLHNVLKITDPSDSWCSSHVCRGQIVYSSSIDFIDGSVQRTYSFSTSFVFSLTIPGTVRSGEGFVFFIIANPYTTDSNGIGDYFGAFPSSTQSLSRTVAVEFDTLRNSEIYDLDDNHIGVDINTAISVLQESCNSINLKLYEGQKIQVWIDYHDSIKMLEVRLAYWSSSVVRPDTPLISLNLNLTNLVDSQMYVGFSGESYSAQEQETAIFSWSFHSTLEAPAPPPPPPQPPGTPIASNASAPAPPFGSHGNQSRNHTRSKEVGIILGLSIGGGSGLILGLGGCFCLGYYCSKKKAAKQEEDRRKKSEATGYAGDTEDGDHSKKYDQEQDVATDDVEADTFGAGILGPLSTRTRSFKIAPADSVDYPTFPALRKGSTAGFVPRTIKTAREIEAEGVETNAIEKRSLAGHAPDVRRNPSLINLEAELPRPEYTDKGVVPHRAALTPPGYGRADDADSGTSDIVYQIPAKPNASVENGARRSNSWSLWSAAGASPQNRRYTSPVPRTAPISSVEIKRTKSWGPWSSGRTREVQVVVKRTEAIRPRKRKVSALDGSPVSSPRRDLEENPHESSERASTPPADTIMFTNTLYNSPPEEPHGPSPSEQGPPQPRDDLYMDDNIYVRPRAENIYDRPPVAMDYGDDIVERVFDVESSKEHNDVDRIFGDVPDRETAIISVTPSPVHTPAQSRGGSRLPSRPGTPSPSRPGSQKPSPAGTTTPSTAGTSGSSSTETTRDSEHRRVKQRPHWRY